MLVVACAVGRVFMCIGGSRVLSKKGSPPPYPPDLLPSSTDTNRQEKEMSKIQRARGQTPRELPLSPLREAVF